MDQNKRHTARPTYVVVVRPGQDDQATVREGLSFMNACKARDQFAKSHGGHHAYDVMRQLPDGTLTTEF